MPNHDLQLKRITLMWIMALSWVSAGSAWWLAESGGTSSLALRVVYGSNLVFHPVFFLVLWWRLMPQRWVDSVCLLFAAGMCAACMALRLYWPEHGARIDLRPLYLWIPVIYVFAFTIFGHRASLRLALAILGLFLVISAPFVALSPDRGDVNFTIQLHAVSAVLISALYFFSSYQHRFQIAQLTVDEWARMANTDELTKLANRRRMTEVMESELLRFGRYGHAFSVILIDIDHFKLINDRFGHALGDRTLLSLATRTKEVLREVDVFGRWGGEEFLVVLPQTAFEETLAKAEALCTHVAARPLIGEHGVTISCGVATARQGDRVETLLERADAALYEAKRAGRNRAVGEGLPRPRVAPTDTPLSEA